MKILILLLLLLGCTGNQAPSLEESPMKIIYASFNYSNPSMGPHEVKSSLTLDMSAYPAEAQDLLDNTQVNRKMSLREYMALQMDGNTAKLQEVQNSYEPKSLNEGESITDLTLTIEGQKSVSFKDLRRFLLTGDGYKAFKELMQEKGIKSIQKPIDPVSDPLNQKVGDDSFSNGNDDLPEPTKKKEQGE